MTKCDQGPDKILYLRYFPRHRTFGFASHNCKVTLYTHVRHSARPAKFGVLHFHWQVFAPHTEKKGKMNLQTKTQPYLLLFGLGDVEGLEMTKPPLLYKLW